MAYDITTFTAGQVNAKAVEAALSLCGIHGERYGRATASREGLDCVGLVERVASEIGAPVHIDRDWQDNGGALSLMEIPVHLAEPGDILVFDLGSNPAFRRFQLGVLTRGGTTDPKAQFVGVPHAVGAVWLNAGPWKTTLIRAYRFDVPKFEPAGSFVIDADLLNNPERLGALIDVLVARMDAIEGDADLEPSLGSSPATCQEFWAQGATDEREEACEDEGVDTDPEPEEGDLWQVTPYSPTQVGTAWVEGVRNPDAFVRRDDR